MRSVILLRSRPGRPWWQLTTRPTTAAVLGLASLVAAEAQVLFSSSPTPWYQLAVAGFWALVGLAFLGSALGTRVRRRRAARARARVPVTEMPFVPVPVRPARPRRREEPSEVSEVSEASEASGPPDEATPEPETGEPTDDLEDAVRTAVNPVVTEVIAPAGGSSLAARLATPARPAEPPRVLAAAVPRPRATPAPAASGEPTTQLPRDTVRDTGPDTGTGSRGRYAVRAVQSVELAARELREEAERAAAERPPAAEDRAPLRDGRVRDRGAHRGRRRGKSSAASTPAAPPRAVSTGTASTPAAPDGAVPTPRGAVEPPRRAVRADVGPLPPSRDSDRGRGSRRPVDERPTGHRPPRSGTPVRATEPSEPATPPTGSRLSFGRSPEPERRPAATRRRAEPWAPEPRDPSSDGRPAALRPAAARPADTGRHAKAGAPERPALPDPAEPRARHAAR
ncbi:hypothetical protein [Actinomycetospora sp. TBRC 11914]|uniref:hypothetical protein n=1 Tax=Actinomycetospora sp. TBRC 11914 TaxID=2729387 RepID=UPI00145DE7EE|nr:hypothetical protein [Actinomycetospora sp. TBRC 11914]NMO91366.1 hypothetical protein [Actinomycetospora sp. TBRC 11914]